MTPVSIAKFEHANVPLKTSRIVAKFDFDIGPVRFRHAKIRENNEDGLLFIEPCGRNLTGGVTIYRNSDEWKEIQSLALKEYAACQKQP